MNRRWRLVETPAQLAKAEKSIRTAGVIALDTEYDSFRYFRDKLCLIQVQTGEQDLAYRSLGRPRPRLPGRGAERPERPQDPPRRRQRHPHPEAGLRLRLPEHLRHPPRRVAPRLPAARPRQAPGDLPRRHPGEEAAALPLGSSPAQRRSSSTMPPSTPPICPTSPKGSTGSSAKKDCRRMPSGSSPG